MEYGKSRSGLSFGRERLLWGYVVSSTSKASQAQKRVTSYDVARIAGVSQSAVSRCFAPGGSVSPSKRERIEKVAKELGFRPNALAQALISKRTNLVAVLISSHTNLYYPEVLDELTRRLTDRNTRILLFSLRSEGEVDDILDQVWRHGVDGAICAARLSDAQISMFEDNGVPLVLYNRLPSAAHAAAVCCDSVAGERMLVDHLVAAGHQQFAIVAGPDDSYVGEERRRAALERLAAHGFADVSVLHGDFSYSSGGEALRRLMAGGSRPDAVICVNDLMAIGAIDTARDEFGLAIPDDISIVGFDGSAPAAWSSYRVTSIRQPVRRMTAAAVAMLFERIEQATPAESRLFVGEFVPGNSARLV